MMLRDICFAGGGFIVACIAMTVGVILGGSR